MFVWPSSLQQLPVSRPGRHVEGSGVDQQLSTWGRTHSPVSRPGLRAVATAVKASHAHLSCCRAVRVRQTWCRSKSPRPLYTTLWEEGQTGRVTTSSSNVGASKSQRRRLLRVSNMDKLLPGLRVWDSWKRIFPGTSMSKRWIWKPERVSFLHLTHEFLQHPAPLQLLPSCA